MSDFQSPREAPPRRLRDSYHLPAFLAIVFWAISYPLTRLCLEHFSPTNLAFVRFFFASITLLCLAAPKGFRLPARRDWPMFIGSGASGFFIYMILFCTGCLTVTSATSAIVIAVSPVATAFLARIIFGEGLAWVKWVAIGIEFVGILLLTLMDGALSINLGVLYLAGAAIMLSTFNLLQRRLTRTYSALDTTLYSVLAGTLMLAIFLPGSIGEVRTASWRQLSYVILMGIVPSAFAFMLWSKALSLAEKTSAVSNYMFATPFFAAILGFIIAGEVPDFATIVGGGVIMLGLGLFTFGEQLLAKMGAR